MKKFNFLCKEEINHKFLLTNLPTNLLTRKRCAFTLAEGATHVGNSNIDRKAAFTLAEVLITLGIIGIVAAITIPSLMAKILSRNALSREKWSCSNLKGMWANERQCCIL